MTTFDALDLKPEIVKAVQDLGFEKATPIQEKTIPHLLSSKQDLLAFAQTGTGKTAAFSLPIINQIDTQSTDIQGLILAPTRELCLQITNDIKDFAKYSEQIITIAVYGGDSIEKQIRALRKGGQIVVSTPGRLCDLIKRKKINLGTIQWLVLDEADEMLTMGFKDDLDMILSTTPSEKQVLLFSATRQTGIDKVVKKFMKSPLTIKAGQDNRGAENLDHHFYIVKRPYRYEALRRVLDSKPDVYGIVFCRTRQETQDIADKLGRDSYNSEAIHGDLSQAQRERVMRKFRQKQVHLLIATDVAARGIDVDDLNYVFNYSLPENLEAYIHRSGRTGRAGKSGTAISFISSSEGGKIRTLERKLKVKFEKQSVPSLEEIREKQLLDIVKQIEVVKVDESVIGEYLEQIYAKLEHLSKEDLIKRLIFREFDKVQRSFKEEGFSSKSQERKTQREKRKKEKASERIIYSKVNINLGKKQGLAPLDLIDLMKEMTGKKSIDIGKIDIDRNSTVFEIDKKYYGKLLSLSERFEVEDTVIVMKPSS